MIVPPSNKNQSKKSLIITSAVVLSILFGIGYVVVEQIQTQLVNVNPPQQYLCAGGCTDFNYWSVMAIFGVALIIIAIFVVMPKHSALDKSNGVEIV